MLVSVELAAERVDEATKVLAQVKSILPDAPIVAVLEGDVALAKGDLDSARSHYENAWSVIANDQLAVKIYQIMRQQSLPEKPIVEFLNDWREKRPTSQLAWLSLAGHHMESGDMTRAQSEYEALVAANPNAVVAYNNLAWLYGEGNLKRALAAGKRGYDLASENGEIIDTYAWFLYKSGELSQAQELMVKAVSFSPENAEIKQHYEEISAK